MSLDEIKFDMVDFNPNDENEDNEFDLLVDPSKSRPVSPENNVETVNEVSFKTIDTTEDEDVKINFSVERENDTKPSFQSTFSQINNNMNNRPVFHNENNSEKQELLFKLKRLEQKGIPLSKHYSRADSLADMRDEYNRVKSQRDLENSIKFQRKALLMTTNGTEFVNKRFDPFGLKLNGWSESVSESIDDYDEVFEELHEKYKGKGEIAPEIKLLMMVGGSAAMFHMSAKLFGNADQNINDIMNSNPDLKRQFTEAAIRNELNNGNQNTNYNDQPLPKPSYNPDESVMSPPEDIDIDRILSSIDQIAPSNPESSVEPKKRRGRPKKVRPETKSFALNI